MKAHGLTLTHRAFVGFLVLWASLMRAFFSVGFFDPSPHGSGQALYELSHVGLSDTSFKKFNLNFLYKK